MDWGVVLILVLVAAFFTGFLGFLYHVVMLAVCYWRSGVSVWTTPVWSSDVPSSCKPYRNGALISWALGAASICALLFSCQGLT